MRFLKKLITNSTMKRQIFFITTVVLLITQLNLFAQNRGENQDRWERYRTEKISFLTTSLDLTPEEAQKFWPVYNQMEKEKSETQMKRRELEHKLRDAEESLSDKKIIQLTRDFVGTLKEEGDIDIKYNEEFLKILPPKKVLKLYNAEGEFRMHMIRKFRDQRRQEEQKRP